MNIIAVLALVVATVMTHLAHAAPPQCAQAEEQKLSLSAAVVELTVWYHEQNSDGSDGHRGTGVFVTPTTIATAEHVATEITIGAAAVVEIGWSDSVDQSVEHRYPMNIMSVSYVETELDERIALLELRAPIAGRTVAPLGFRPLQDKEPVFGIAYRNEVLRFAHGVHHLPERSSEPSEGESKLPPLLFELADWENSVRMVFDFGSSGGMVVNCDGRVVALMSQAVTQELDIAGFLGVLNVMGMSTEQVKTRVSTAWGQYNMTGLPASLIHLEE